jgi:ParB/RepB/Spo0J family partition protein
MGAPTSKLLEMISIRAPSDPHRLYIDPETLGALADDIAANGLHQAIGVVGPTDEGIYEVAYGHRRYLAHQLLRRDVIEAKIYPPGTDVETARASENLAREQLTPIEEAHIIERYLKRGESRAAIARLMRRSAAWVDHREHLLHLPDDLQEAVHRGELTIGVACELAQIDHQPYRDQLTREAMQNGASLPVVRVWVAHYHADKGRIVSNAHTMDELLAARTSFVPYYPCDACGEHIEYTKTRSLRFCLACARQLAEASASGATG